MARKVVAVVQARMSSTRLPGKVMMRLADRPILDWIFRAARCSTEIDEVILATSLDPSDDLLADYAQTRDIAVVRGSLNDVLERFVLAAEHTQADAIVRLTADCPLLDPALIDAVVSMWRHNDDTDYVATTLHRTLPRGLDVECVKVSALLDLREKATGYHRTHVTSMLYAAGSQFSQLGLVTSPDRSQHRLTVDTPQDFEALSEITSLTGDRIVSWTEILEILNDHPQIASINKDIRQKDVSEG